MDDDEMRGFTIASMFLVLSVILAASLYTGTAGASSHITGAATQGSGTVDVYVLEEVVQMLGGGGGGGRVSPGICPETCTFGETRCYAGELNICVPVFKLGQVCGVWMLVDCPGECSEGKCGECVPDWQAFPWSVCSADGMQSRTLVDYNSCYPELQERAEFRECAPSASCSDGIRNLGEESIDCGGPCAPCEYPAAVTPPSEEPRKPVYTCGDSACGALEFCWQDCRAKMTAIPISLAAILLIALILPFILMNFMGDYSTRYALRKAISRISSGNFAAANRIFMRKVEPKYINFMARYTSSRNLHRDIESLYAEAKMYLRAHDAELSMKIGDSHQAAEAMKEARKLAKRFEAAKPASERAYQRFGATAENLKAVKVKAVKSGRK